MEVFDDPVKMWTLFAALFVAVIVVSAFVFIALRFFARLLSTLLRRIVPEQIRTWFATVGDHSISWEAYRKGNTALALEVSARTLGSQHQRVTVTAWEPGPSATYTVPPTSGA